MIPPLSTSGTETVGDAVRAGRRPVLMTAAVLKLWRTLPASLRRRAHLWVQAVSRALIPVWLGLAWRRGRGSGTPAAVLGLMRSSIGIGQGARLFGAALQASGAQARTVDVAALLQVTSDLEGAPAPARLDAAAPGGVVVTHLNPPELERLIEVTRGRFLKGARHVGYWAWELPVAPPRWRRSLGYVDEVWTPSHFTAQALRALRADGPPVHVVPHPVWAWPTPTPDRSGFDLPLDRPLVLVALDLRSTAARKNPSGAMEAFQRAVDRGASRATLVCKLSGAHAEPALFAELQAECARRGDIRLIGQTLSEERMRALVASIDIVLSPHRAEGFGLLLAEGMRLGKAVVATGWSGNMDFMDEGCAALIRHTLTPVVDPQGMYRDAWWAEPDLDHAADLLARLIEDEAARSALSAAAAARGGPVFDPAAWRALVAERLSL